MNWDLIDGYTLTLTSLVLFAFQGLGFFSILHALRRVRTSQAIIAWSVGLITLPIVVVPCYWIFGRSRFFGYRELMRHAMEEQSTPAQRYQEYLADTAVNLQESAVPLHRLSLTVDRKVTMGNQLELLIDGDVAYEAMFEAIRNSKKYVLAQFFIIQNDDVGRRFADALIERATAGVEVRLLYDNIGSQWLPRSYLRRLIEGGVVVSSFNMREGFRYRLQVNFRNHRKVVVVDGVRAFTGGLNIGDEYRGKGPDFDVWRDTNVSIRGPVVQAIQAAFAMDWYWSRHEALAHLVWKSEPVGNTDGQACVLVTGPADERHYCSMMFCEMAAAANQRLWIATPYFVPDEAVATALESAAARGVDVRVLIPSRPDHYVAFLAGIYYEDELTAVGVKVYRYQPGFMHQKVVLVDRSIAAVGSTNLDNRSIHLNFELMVASSDHTFTGAVERMLTTDFAESIQSAVGALNRRPYLFQMLVDAARLFSPIL